MQFRELEIPHAVEISPVQHPDARGVFLEWFRLDLLEQATGRTFAVRQANQSVSGQDVLRGIHFADVPPGQAKVVTVSAGAVLDYIVDLRVGSPTFGQWDSVLLDAVERKGVFLAEGLGHAFVTLEPHTIVNYLVTETYNREHEHALHPLDPQISLKLPSAVRELEISARDQAAPSLEEARLSGLLPQWDECLALYAELAVQSD